MKALFVSLAALALAGNSTTALAKGGTDILHFFNRTAFAATDFGTNASGTVYARENTQGHADNETVTVSLKGLETNAPYTLLLSTVDDSNLTAASDFTTDARGRANLNFRKVGNGHGPGHGKQALPALMDTVSALRSFQVVDANTQAVLNADLTLPARLEYLVKRNLSNNDVTATLRIQANTHNSRLRISARGLAATNDYLLVLNGEIAQTNSTDARGRLEMATALLDATDILNLRSVAVLDSSSNVVVSTTLP